MFISARRILKISISPESKTRTIKTKSTEARTGVTNKEVIETKNLGPADLYCSVRYRSLFPRSKITFGVVSHILKFRDASKSLAGDAVVSQGRCDTAEFLVNQNKFFHRLRICSMNPYKLSQYSK